MKLRPCERRTLVAEWAFQSAGSRIGWSAIFGGSAVLVGVGGNVGLVVAQAHANRKPAAIVGRTDVPGVGSIAQQSRMIGTARKTFGRGTGVAIVGGDTEPGERPGQEGKVLKVGGFETGNPCTAGVNRLSSGECAGRYIWRRLEIGEDESLGDDRIGEPLVKVSSGDHSERIQIVFNQHVEVISGFGFQVWISKGNLILEVAGTAGSREGDGLGDVLRIGARKAPAIDQAKIGVGCESVAERNAWQHLHVGTAETVTGWGIARGSVEEEISDA